MTELGDRFREFAELCDSHPDFVAAGVVALPKEIICTAYTTSKDCGEKEVAMAIYHGVMEPPEKPSFVEILIPGALA